MVLVNMWIPVQCVWTSRLWLLTALVTVTLVVEVVTLNGPNVCMVKQKYNITKRIKYRAPMSVRTYEWCFSMPPRCSRWNTEMRDLTRLETEERIAEVSVCCPGYKMKDVSCVPICPNGKTGHSCSDDCEPNRWGPNCVHECKDCSKHGTCSPVTGECVCQEGWQGESCATMLTTSTTSTTPMEELLTTSKATTKTTIPSSTIVPLVTTPRSPVIETAAHTTVTTSTTVTSTANNIFLPTTPKTETMTHVTTLAEIKTETIQPAIETTKFKSPKLSVGYNTTLSSMESESIFETTSNKTTLRDYNIIYNITAKPVKTSQSTYSTVLPWTPTETGLIKISTSPTVEVNRNVNTETTAVNEPMSKVFSTKTPTFFTTTIKMETTKRPETTVKIFPTTLKFKPKEIWIRPAQKEPEHITAVMSEKETEKSTVDLISVISIAGGVMMAVITVAVVIVMMERCRRPRYDDAMKINDIRMQVMIDSNDVPPPYVRSIFHTPLPDPPTLEKCHYQPISTLDRNLKQFMRPVVVQTISPIMLENFRGILECHYDHLPRRSHDFATLQPRSIVAPSIHAQEQQLLQRASLTESAIEALKCEAKLDIIDSTTSEPLYAEIPCWRPPSEHAIEIINTNGEAVTEL